MEPNGSLPSGREREPNLLTMAMSLSGRYEVPFGNYARGHLRWLVASVGKDLKAVLIGAHLESHQQEDLDRQFAFRDLPPGGALIVDEDKCIGDIMQNCAKFFLHESYPDSAPCREGTKRH